MKSYFVLAVLVVVGVVVVSGEEFDCDNYNPMICTADAILFCLNNGTVITGRCHAQRAVCVDKRGLDMTFSACGRGGGDEFDCDQYLANPNVCTRDLNPFCLTNGTVVRGTCLAKRAVCVDKQTRDDDFSSCDKAGHSSGPDGSQDNDTGDNSATALSATLSLACGLLLSLRF